MTNKNLYECKECSGTGVIVVSNAYEPNYNEEFKCDYCGGLGYTTENIEYIISGDYEEDVPYDVDNEKYN